MNKITDSVYGEIILDETELWVKEIIQTSAFQRLHHIKQMGLCYKTFPGGVQTRFAHSLGTFYLAKKLLSRHEIKKLLTLKQINTIKAAALLHDIGHACHSHGLEWYLYELGFEWFKHEDFSVKIVNDENLEIANILKLNGISPYDVGLLIQAKQPENFPKWTSSVISGQIDVDRLDYMVRDEYYVLSTTNNMKNLITIIDKVKIDDEKEFFYYDEDDIRIVNDFLYSRYFMHRDLYLSESVNAWYRAIIQILIIAKELYYNKNFIFKDCYNLLNLFTFLFKKQEIKLDKYMMITDQTFDLFIKSLQYEDDRIKKIYNLFESGKFEFIPKNHTPKDVIFYDENKPILIKKKNNEYINYEKISDLYKIFSK